MKVEDALPEALARRLRDLRKNHWPGMEITQARLHEAMGISPTLISSWESTKKPTIPPQHRLEMYAAFFATKRSIENDVARVLSPSELTKDELHQRRILLDELLRLRGAALRSRSTDPIPEPRSAQNLPFQDPWHFTDGNRITIICSQLPKEDLAKIPNADPAAPNYVEFYKYSDLDSLFELWGHLRAMNPHSRVTLRTAEDLRSEDLSTHLVLLGGIDYNRITASMLERIKLPVRQVADWGGEKGPYFEVDDGGDTHRYYPVIHGSQDKQLLEDVGFYYRGINPANVRRTLTICNGMYARGVYGAVRALTDEQFRERNAAYLHTRFDTATSYSILTRVAMEGRITLTPDWTIDASRLHEWPEPGDGG
ncbi:hypothetical protein [Nonomuraea sp. NPDC049480]|uniref:hypothetical protein n=1 Tax=Nonomuraea sp. NPDC049480 TaxID=3364353 RepID=UPI0037A3C562